MRLTADKKEAIMAARGVSARESDEAVEVADGKKTVWSVRLPSGTTFTMGGQAMTLAEATEFARCIWPLADVT